MAGPLLVLAWLFGRPGVPRLAGTDKPPVTFQVATPETQQGLRASSQPARLEPERCGLPGRKGAIRQRELHVVRGGGNCVRGAQVQRYAVAEPGVRFQAGPRVIADKGHIARSCSKFALPTQFTPPLLRTSTLSTRHSPALSNPSCMGLKAPEPLSSTPVFTIVVHGALAVSSLSAQFAASRLLLRGSISPSSCRRRRSSAPSVRPCRKSAHRPRQCQCCLWPARPCC